LAKSACNVVTFEAEHLHLSKKRWRVTEPAASNNDVERVLEVGRPVGRDDEGGAAGAVTWASSAAWRSGGSVLDDVREHTKSAASSPPIRAPSMAANRRPCGPCSRVDRGGAS
jgi:hypothetical protein